MARQEDDAGSTLAAAARRWTPGKAGALAVAFLMMGMLGAGAEVTAPVEGLGPTIDAAKLAPGAGGHFEPNLGQFPDHVRFLVRGAGMHAFLTDEGATFVLREETVPEPPTDPFAEPWLDGPLGAAETPSPPSLFAVHLRFEDATPGPMEGTERRQGISNHFIGNDPDKWVTHVPHYGRVIQRDVWPGIDVEWHIAPQGLKFDAVVHPGAESSQVRFTLPGAKALQLGAAGDLVIGTPLGELVKEAPYTYQETPNGVQEVPSRYVLDGGAVGFGVGPHDPSRPLVIDPLVYATYIGGSSVDQASGIAVDEEGHAYMVGRTSSQDFPTTPGAFQPGIRNGYDAMVTKLTPAGDGIVFSTYLGGSGLDVGMAIAVDSDQSVYVTGVAYSDNFPLENAFQETRTGGTGPPRAVFVTKINATGASLDYSTYLGGSGDVSETGYGIAVDADGSAYVTGMTSSRDFPVTPRAAFVTYPGTYSSAFVTKFEPEGNRLAYSTFLGGSTTGGIQFGNDYGTAIAVDKDGSAYVTGKAHTLEFPTNNRAFQRDRGAAGGNSQSYDAFVTKFTPDGGSLAYSTYLGGSTTQMGTGIAVDGAGHAYVTGWTRSTDFPTEAAHQDENPGGTSAFLTKMNLDGSLLEYSTYLGGERDDSGAAVAVDAAGRAFVSGWTRSPDFPIHNAFQEGLRGAPNAFAAAFLQDGSGLAWSTYLGGTGGSTGAAAVALDGAGSVYLAGATGSEDFPVTPGAFQTVPQGSSDAFVSKLYGIRPGFAWTAECPVMLFEDQSVSVSGAPLVRSRWDFGDGSVNRFEPPVGTSMHPYAAPGEYNVSLTVHDVHGLHASVTQTVSMPDCPPPNFAPSLRTTPCIVSTPGQQLSFRLHATVPNGPPDPPSYYTLRFFADGLPADAVLDPDGRFTWHVGSPDTYTFVAHVEDGEGLGDSAEYCIQVRPDKPAPERSDDSGDGVQNWHGNCPYAKDPGQADAAADIDDDCGPQDASSEPAEAPAEEGPPPGGCPSQPAGPREVTARWTDGAVQVTWQSDSWCPPDHFLVWNGTGHHLVDFVPAEAGVHHVVLNLDPWPEPHQYFVQAMGAEEGLFFDPARAVASNLIDPAGCVAEGPRSEACLPLRLDDEPPAAVAPAGPGAAAPAESGNVGFFAAAAALAVAGLLALLWRLRHAPWVVHLFSRLGRDEVLEHPVRRDIMALVTTEPGIHYAEILRRTGKKPGATKHHLKVLAAAGAVSERRDGQYLCYYPPEEPRNPVHGGLLRAEAARRLLRLLVAEPGLPVAELARRLGADRSTVRYHLQRFEKAGLATIVRHAAKAAVHPGSASRDALAALAPDGPGG